MRIPTDIELLRFIYKEYYQKFINFSKEEKTRSTKIYVPISIKEIADHFNIDEDIIFGRLYYYFNNKYSYKDVNNVSVQFFTVVVAKDRHCVHFPLLTSVLASMQEENRRFWTTTLIAFYATLLAAIAIIISIFIN